MHELWVDDCAGAEQMKNRPSRLDLLTALSRAQTLFGKVQAAANDRNPNRAEDIKRLTQEGFDLCLSAREFDPPTDANNSDRVSK